MSRTLTHAEARRVYDRIGSRQDTQAFYEDAAIEALIAQADFGAAHAVLEFGCGTGRFAAALLDQELPLDARYLGVDVSPVMVAIARARLARFGDRAEIRQSDGGSRIDVPDGSFQRFVSTYVFDLLSQEQIAEVIREAGRVLAPGGLLGVVGLTCGFTPVTRWVERVWRRVHDFNPAWVGGCRPLDLGACFAEPASEHGAAPGWVLRHRERLSLFGIPSEVLVAERRDSSAPPTVSTV